MQSRRKFVVQGGLATAAAMIVKPFQTIARPGSLLQQLANGSDHLVFYHTASISRLTHAESIHYIRKQCRLENAIVLNTAKELQPEVGFDTGFHDETVSHLSYKVFVRNGVKTGFLFVEKDETSLIANCNRLAAMLKNEKGCQVVACVSKLGYRNTNANDDMKIAEGSRDIDIIVGAHTTNYAASPRTVRNQIRGEVIMHSPSSNPFAFGRIEFSFDTAGSKRDVRVMNKIPLKTA